MITLSLASRACKRLFLMVAGCISLSHSFAQKPQLVENINPPFTVYGSSGPNGFTLFNGKLVFWARDTMQGGNYGKHLLWEWSQMGLKAKRLNADSGSLYEPLSDTYHDMPILTGKLYYARFDPARPYAYSDIVAYDGVRPSVTIAPASATPVYKGDGMFSLNNRLYFLGADSLTRANHPQGFNYLYRYDGLNTPQPVAQLYSSNVTRSYHFSSGDYRNYAVFQSKIYYVNDSTGFGKELFCYDPVSGKTSMVADIAPGPHSSNVGQYVSTTENLYFSANDSAHGRELYAYDGYTVRRLTDRLAGPADGVSDTLGICAMGYYNKEVLFCGKGDTARFALYRYNTVSGAITKLKETPKTDSIYTPPSGFYATPYRLYFYMGTSATGNELWKYDSGKVSLIAHYNVNNTLNGSTRSQGMIYYKGYLYFGYSDSTWDIELYRLQDSVKSTGIQIQSLRWQGNAVLHPNPADNSAWLRITQRLPQQMSISLIDVQGRVVYDSGPMSMPGGSREVPLPVQGLVPGQYFYRVADEKGRPVASGSMVKQ